MQDIHSMSGAAGRIYGGDRRMRPHPHQALKCPRCDSLNTKFCYYNNYNLSQPRHFCKSCRRYWTKGGVLRNVPVGGGCRKTKRSKPKSNGPDDPTTAADDDAAHRRDRKTAPASHSSSESSSLTATAAAATATTDAAASVASSSAAALLNFPDSALFQSPIAPNANAQFEPAAVSMIDDSTIFPETGSFTSLMTASNPAFLGLNFADLAASVPFRYNQQQQQQQQQQKMAGLMEEMKMQELTAGFMDQTVSVELPPLQGRGINGGLTALDWQGNGDQGLFDLAGGVIDQGYWAHSQWADIDQTLHLP